MLPMLQLTRNNISKSNSNINTTTWNVVLNITMRFDVNVYVLQFLRNCNEWKTAPMTIPSELSLEEKEHHNS